MFGLLGRRRISGQPSRERQRNSLSEPHIRRELIKRRDELELEKQKLLEESARLNPNQSEDVEILDDNRAKVEQIDESKLDIEKQLAANETIETDFEQLDWLQEKLIESWHTKEVRGRVLYFHHPPYVTEATKWNQAQTMEVRYHLRRVLVVVHCALLIRRPG